MPWPLIKAGLYNFLCVNKTKNPEAQPMRFRDSFFWYSDRGSNPGPLPCENSEKTAVNSVVTGFVFSFVPRFVPVLFLAA